MGFFRRRNFRFFPGVLYPLCIYPYTCCCLIWAVLLWCSYLSLSIWSAVSTLEHLLQATRWSCCTGLCALMAPWDELKPYTKHTELSQSLSLLSLDFQILTFKDDREIYILHTKKHAQRLEDAQPMPMNEWMEMKEWMNKWKQLNEWHFRESMD